MDDYLVVSTHLSALDSTSASTVIVPTTRRNAPLAVVPDSDLPLEHATSSSVLTTTATGTILMRVIHGGLIVELVSLSTPVPPLRFVLPAAIIPTPSLFLFEESEIHIILITEIGSLFRLIIPIDGLKLWTDQADNIWPREYYVQNLPTEHAQECSVHALGTHSVAVSLPSGVLLRLEAETMGYDVHDDEEWTETVSHHGSFLSSLTSFLPIHSSSPNASDIISMSSHPWPTDIGSIWTLSRDRTLRMWKARLGCVTSKMLPASPNMKEPSTSASASAKYLLLDAERQNLVKVFSVASEDETRLDVYVLVFIPTPSSTSGGFFCLLDTSTDHFVEVGIIECPRNTAHCHLQDFTVSGNNLYALWDRQGQSVVERTTINFELLLSHDLAPTIWKTSEYMQQSELTPTNMEEQLLLPGSLTEKFLSAIMKPGVFSSLTLRTALDRYIEACLTLPGPQPPQLSAVYSSLCENIAAVVGCTVTLNRDHQTGGFQHANYWTALKRDWEGFVARCREIERSARWPLAIAAQGPQGVIVVERERVGSLVVEDVPISLCRMLQCDQPPHAQYDLFAIIWALRSKLGPQILSSLESRVVDIMHQEIAFSFAEILQDQARRIAFVENLEEGAASWFVGRLQSVADLDRATRNALDAIGGLDLAIKKEYTDTELLHPPPSSQWLRSQSAAFTTITVEARYDLCLCLIILLFFCSEELSGWDASLLAEVFAVFRGLAILRYISSQPAETQMSRGQVDVTSPDDVATQLRNMNVSKNKTQVASKSSLVYLLSQSPPPDGIASAAHNFLDSTGLLQSISPAHATRHEILFCEKVRTLGFSGVTSELLSWLPRTPGATYLQSQVFLSQGRIDDASQLLESLAGAFGVNNITLEDAEALSAVLPNSQLIDSQYSFYLFAADLFKNGYVYHEAYFSQLAIRVAPPSADTTSLWNTVVKGLTDLALYDDAYAAAMATPFENEKRELATQLAVRMCEGNAVAKLMSFDFSGIASEVEAALAFKARNTDPRIQPCYSRILYTWHIRRGDYRNASLSMFQRARKLRDVISDSTSFIALAEDQLESLSVAINALNLVEDKSAWILMPAIPDPTGKRQKVSKHIPESKFVTGKYDAEIISLAEMEYEYILLRAQIDIIKRDPSILSSPEYLLPPALIVMRLAQANQYTQAMATARSLKVDMTDVFIHLTNQCIRLTTNPGSLIREDTSGWLLTDIAASWQGAPSDRGWRYLQQSLKRHDGHENDYRYTKASFETILSVGKSSASPPWLIDSLEKYQPEYLIRISLKYENIADAVNFTYALVLKSDKHVSRESSRDASSTWLPYALIDQVLIAADAQITHPQHLTQLKTALNNRIKRMQKFSQNVS
ncbi:Nuclear pore complex protein Nup160 [Psilocybe cubensis]|uniref:Uncharacterized protein n=2 Tax=Psilocybe cubensis TaxID=181762 RepID=A0A8H8CLG7_PSICU|nr:Nuclear pore complex protein Nup160 [Psilocybe cubensis]KAH9482452.1 Nuclear pore complex protein Nup160 [Psilocybe cubensis]